MLRAKLVVQGVLPWYGTIQRWVWLGIRQPAGQALV